MTDYVSENTGEVLEITKPEAGIATVQAHESAAMDVQVTTAQKLGRSIKHFQADLEAWACHTQQIAQECTYILRKGGERIVGPSIRFAELLQAAYRHIVIDAFIEHEGHDHILVGAIGRDLYRNIAIRTRVRRNILTREGKRYGPDMIQTTTQAATSLAIRNAIIRLVPKALWLEVWLKSRAVAQGADEDGKVAIPFSERVARAFSFLSSLGATEDQVLQYLGKESRKDLDPDDLIDLQNRARAIKSGEMDVDAAFPVEQAERPSKAEEAADRIRKATGGAKQPARKGVQRTKPQPKPDETAPVEEPQDEEPDDEVPAVDL